MKKLNCLIVDDEPLAREGIAHYCTEFPFLNVVGICKNALQINAILQENTVDLIFLDINMPLITGIEWLKKQKATPYIIFTTAYTEHALESFSFDVLDYLVKPISLERFTNSMLKVSKLLDNSDQKKHLFVKSNGVLKKIKIANILFLESMQNYVKIVLEKETVITHSTLKDLKSTLDDSEFIQTHKSFVISKKHILKIVGNLIHLQNHTVPISTRMKKEVLGNLKA